jgi:hypothetical protein
MNEQLKTLMDRVQTWPEDAQAEALRVLTVIEREHLSAVPAGEHERDTKLAALRDTINRSIERGGSHTDEEVAAHIERLHAKAESESS